MNVSFSVPPSCILREYSTEEDRLLYPGGQWLPGVVMNSAGNCLSLNAKRSLDDVMVMWRNEGNDDLPLNCMTLKELHTEVWYVIFLLESHILSIISLNFQLITILLFHIEMAYKWHFNLGAS